MENGKLLLLVCVGVVAGLSIYNIHLTQSTRQLVLTVQSQLKEKPAAAGVADAAETTEEDVAEAAAADLVQERAEAKDVQNACLSNIKQLSLAMMMYCQDYDERMPRPSTWGVGIVPYSMNLELFRCLAAPESAADWSYALNSGLESASLGQITNPAATVGIFESDLGTQNAVGQADSVAAPRHNGGNNWGFVDGHVTWDRATLSFGP